MGLEVMVATRKGLFTAVRHGRGTWRLREPQFLGVPVSAVLFDWRLGERYAALDHGHFGVKLHRTTDGRTWTELNTPHYPKAPPGRPEKDGIGRPWPRKLRLIWELAIDPSTLDGLWCGTIPGGLFRSPSRGDQWYLVQSLWDQKARKKWFGGGYDTPGVHSVLVDPRDCDTITVGISCGGVWRSRDNGTTWTNIADGMRADFMPAEQGTDPDIQDPHRLAHCRAAPDRLWSQHHCGIYRRDGDRPWREVKGKAPSRFGFACAAHPEDPDVAWFVPAVKDECRVPVDGRMVVTQTRDGGKTFSVLAQGLPRKSWDLVYRHGLVVAGDGNTMAMGSTSGGLWISEDGGKRWLTVDERLPPIYAVRFAES